MCKCARPFGRSLVTAVLGLVLLAVGEAVSSAHPLEWRTPASLEGSTAIDSQRQPQKFRYCDELSEEERRATESCKTEEEKREDARKKRDEARAEKEKPTKSSFWRRVHLDLPGIRAENKQTYICCSVIGVHLTVAVVKRLQFFGPPGFLLVRQEVSPGEWQWRPAYSWGLGYYLGDLKLPVLDRPTKFYFNLTRIWTTQAAPAQPGFAESSGGVSMAGLSVVFAR